MDQDLLWDTQGGGIRTQRINNLLLKRQDLLGAKIKMGGHKGLGEHLFIPVFLK